ncbi:protein hu-li tai shao isoform X1 [Drosophila yakuba]|uniref:protein hu-li tai shao isoform X1 n=1 Tax=Drosophila yakuba TaxID=7245 RepID=UPI0019307C54|nr:protein hu-li tai shao isoform X1 [Drosophila yakuba]XP_039228474.1 protein hu-li tai shao isoform X1 [Drosophila yakuba]
MTEVEQPPQNGIDPTAGEDDDNSKARPADIEQDMREMERRKRVEAIMGSKLFREELERIVDSARDGGAGASGILQQLSDIVGVPVSRVGNVFKSSNCMVPINDIRGVESMGYAKGEKILRCKLAATFRLLDLYGWTQGLGAQITARLKVDQEYFLVNPYGLLYHEITASALNKVDMQGQIVEQGTTNFGSNKSHFVLHSVVHAARPDIRCAIYIGCSPVVAISSLKSGLLPLTKDACVLGEITTHAYTGLFDERNRLVRSLGPNSKVILLSNHGALCCGETIEEAFFAACHIVQACETQLKLLPVGLDNLVLIPEESRKAIYEESRRPPEDLEKKFAAVAAGEDSAAAAEKEAAEAVPKVGSPPKWRVGGAEFEALMRMLDNAGYRTGYIYRHPLIKSDPPKPKNDVELPPAVSSLGYLLEEEELFRQGIWKKGDIRKGGDRSRWLNSPNVYQKVEVLETGTPDPKKITKWVAEGSPTHSTPVRIEDPLQFVPAGTNPREFKRVQQLIKDNRRADKISAGPQSHILEGVTWDEASRLKDATVSQAGDHVVMMGAASKGIIQRGFQHNATVYKAPYAKNPFDNVTDDELNEYKRTVERKKKSVHGEYTDTDFSESEAVLQAGTKKYPQSEPETEHQVIEIQTQQAPVPRQAEVVLSDGENKNNEYQICVDDKENQLYERNRNIPGNSKCRRDLFATKGEDPISSPDHLYTYVYATAGSLGQCAQPKVCSALLRALHSEQLGYLASCYRGGAGHSNATTASTCTITSATGSSTASRRPLQHVNIVYPQPYRTGSHFGFNSPRQHPHTEHKHVPKERDHHALGYRPMQRGISYEEIFATPRYEQLCQACFDKLLRLKPELQRIGTATAASSCAEELTSAGSTPMQRRQMPTLSEAYDYVGQMEKLPPPSRVQCNAYTQTKSSSPSSSIKNFLSQIEKFNFSEESTNIDYTARPINSESSLLGLVVEQACSSAGASATSAPPRRIYRAEQLDITEVWSFGRWLEPQDNMIAGNADEFTQQPLTEHCITSEFNQDFSTADNQVERQLMSREERQRRKSEFEELCQDHEIRAKGHMQTHENISLDRQEVVTFSADDCIHQDMDEIVDGVNDERMTEPSDELPKILQKFEESLTLAGENLGKLVESTKKLQGIRTETSPVSSSSSPVEIGNLLRSISLVSITSADDTVSVHEPLFDLSISPSIAISNEEDDGLNHILAQEEKRDDEKPVTPISTEPDEPSDKEKDRVDEKDMDENDIHVEAEFREAPGETIKVTVNHNNVVKDSDENDHLVETEIREFKEVRSLEADNQFFTPLEREILQRIEKDKLDESEPIFGKIDHSIRNKLTPKKLQDLVTEEIFRTHTHIYTNPRTPISKNAPHDTTLTPSGSSLSAHNISAPCSLMAHTHLVTRPTPRMSRSWSEDQQSVEDEQKKNGEEQQKYIDKDTPLDRVISSTTFVCRSSPNRKRNFIQENIRNASRPRIASGAIRKHKSNTVTSPKAKSSPSSVCAFQCGQRDSGARLWVALPTPPRARAVYAVRGNPPSPFAKRRKTVVILPPMRSNIDQHSELNSSNESLHRTHSSSTFFVPDEEGRENSDNISTSTFQMEEAEKESPVSQGNRNATSNSVYYSANDTTREEGESSQSDTERRHLLEIYNSSSDNSLEVVMETSLKTDGHVNDLQPSTTILESPEICSQLEEDGSSLELTRLAGGSDAHPIPLDTTQEEKSVLQDMDDNDDQPSTSKAAMEKLRIIGDAGEPKENPYYGDEDVVTLDTVCIVRGLEMFVREVEPINHETSEELSEFGGLFENGLIDEDSEEAMSQ